MIAYKNDPAVKQSLLSRIAAHEQADTIRKGFYAAELDGEWRYCAVGCSVYDTGEYDRVVGVPTPDLYSERLGLPVWLAHLEDAIFEGLPEHEARTWPRRFAEAIPVGAVLDRERIDRLGDLTNRVEHSERLLTALRAAPVGEAT